MGERLTEAAFDSKLATRLVLGGITAALAGLLYWGGSSIYETSVGQKLMAQQMGALVDTVTDLKARIEAGSTDRYTGASAASDRAAFLQAFTSALQSQASQNADLFQTISDRAQAISIRQTEFDKSLKELLDFKARAEERWKLEGKP